MESIVSRVTKIKLRTKATKLVKAKLINNVTPSRISGHLFSAFTTFGIADSFILSASVSLMLCHTFASSTIPHERKMMKFSFIHSSWLKMANGPGGTWHDTCSYGTARYEHVSVRHEARHAGFKERHD